MEREDVAVGLVDVGLMPDSFAGGKCDGTWIAEAADAAKVPK